MQRFGIELDEAKNQAAVAKEAAIHSERSAVQVRVRLPCHLLLDLLGRDWPQGTYNEEECVSGCGQGMMLSVGCR